MGEVRLGNRLCIPSGKQQFPLLTPDEIEKSKGNIVIRLGRLFVSLIVHKQVHAREVAPGFESVFGVARYFGKKAEYTRSSFFLSSDYHPFYPLAGTFLSSLPNGKIRKF